MTPPQEKSLHELRATLRALRERRNAAEDQGDTELAMRITRQIGFVQTEIDAKEVNPETASGARTIGALPNRIPESALTKQEGLPTMTKVMIGAGAAVIFFGLLGQGGSRTEASGTVVQEARAEEARTPDAIWAAARRDFDEGRIEPAGSAAERLIRDHAGTAFADSAEALMPRIERQREVLREAAERDALARKWSYSATQDAMTSRTNRQADILSENTVSFDFPYGGPQNATLTVRHHAQYGRDVILRIERGQILCQSYDPCSVRVRFDDGPVQSFRGNSAADGSTEVVFIQGYDRFLQRMRSAQTVRIQIPVYQEGAPMFEFKVGGFDHARYSSG